MVGGCDCTTRARIASQAATGKETVLKTTAPPSTATRSTSVPGTSAPTKTSAPPPSGAPVPPTEPALLTPQPEPQCGSATAGTGSNDPQRLDYERQCYRHAEMIVRARLDLLQEAVRRNERASP